MEKGKKKDGITLIALVVTIVVLLILASVSITVIFGDNGIITMAQKAAKETQEAADKDKEDLAKLDEYLTSGNWSGTNPTEYVNPKKGVIIPEQSDGKTNVEWKEKVDEEEKIAKIPVGFCVVKDIVDTETGNITEENNITNGLVISDVENDDLENNAGGNQFVWVPVEKFDKFVRIDGFSAAWINHVLSDTASRDKIVDSCAEAGKEGDSLATTESMAMHKSVAENGGFYFARYEAGLVDKVAPTESVNDLPVADGTVKPVSKKGVYPWNGIQWSASQGLGSDEISDDNIQIGAVKVARSMYHKSEGCGVTSTLCYGVQWDALMQFIDPLYSIVPADGEEETVSKESHVRRPISGSECTEIKCGVNPDFQICHVYGLGTNVKEWTMESSLDGGRVLRGANYGCYSWLGTTISSRIIEQTGDTGLDSWYNGRAWIFSNGFRVTLFL